MMDTSNPIASAIYLSIVVGICSTIFAFPIALGFGWILARWQFPAKALLSTICLAPAVLPPVVTGYLLLRAFGNRSWLGEHLGLQVAFSLEGAILAALVVGLPFYIMGARSAFESIDTNYEDVALSHGLTRWQCFFRVSLPLAFPGIAAGAILAFARSLGEFGATAVLAGNIEGKTRTVALAIYTLLESPTGMDDVNKLVMFSIMIAALTLVLYELLVRWQRRRLE